MEQLDINEVLKQLSVIGNMPLQDTYKYMNLAEFSIDEVNKKIKKDVMLDEKAVVKLTFLAATILYYRYLLFTDNGNSNIATVGKIKNGGLDIIFNARMIKDQSICDCKEYLNDDDFIFERTEFYE